MKTLLNTYWNIGTAMGEFVSAMLLVYLILVVSFSIHAVYGQKEKVNPSISFILKPFLYVLSTYIAILVGTTITTSYSGPGQWYSQTTTTFAWVSAIHSEVYKALPFIFVSQTLGAIFGYILFTLHIRAHNSITGSGIKIKDHLMLEKGTTKQVTIKHLFIYTIMGLIVVFVMRFDLTSTGITWGDKMLIIIMTLIIPIALGSTWGWFVFSPNMALAGLIFGFLKKEINKQVLINTTIAVAMQFAIFGAIAYAQLGLEIWGGKFHFG